MGKKTLILGLFSLLILTFPQSAQAAKQAGSSAIPSTHKAEVGPASPPASPGQGGQDNRAKVLKAYLKLHNSPLAESSDTFVKKADQYSLDWKLVVAISGLESTFGQAIPANSYNAWGWGIYGDNVIRFNSWDEGIATISQGLRQNYIDKGAQDVYQIGRLYAASPTWAQRVEYFMRKIDEFAAKDPSSLSISL